MPRKSKGRLTVKKGRDAKGALRKGQQQSQQSNVSTTSQGEVSQQPTAVDVSTPQVGQAASSGTIHIDTAGVDNAQAVTSPGKASVLAEPLDIIDRGAPKRAWFNRPRHIDSSSDSDDETEPLPKHATPTWPLDDEPMEIQVSYGAPAIMSVEESEPAHPLELPEEVIDDFVRPYHVPVAPSPPPPLHDEAAEYAAMQEAVERDRNRAGQLATYLRATVRDEAPYHLGEFTGRCRHCEANFFRAELDTRGVYNRCCRTGRVQLPQLQAAPRVLSELFGGTHLRSAVFKRNVLQYNYAFQFVSMEAQLRDGIADGRGPFVYAIQGKVYHHISDVNVGRELVTLGPIYFLDPEIALQQRLRNDTRDRLDEGLLREISDALRDVNPYARAYRHLREVYDQQRQEMANGGRQMPNVVLELLSGGHAREFDLPVVNEVAAVYRVNEALPPCPNLRVVVRNEDAPFRTVSEDNDNNDPMSFPLLFPAGDRGWHIHLRHGNHNITLCDYYVYRLAYRDNYTVFLNGGRLTQQYIMLAYIKIESNRIKYILTRQNEIRADEYVGLADYLHRREQADDLEPIGRMVILPSTFSGSPRSQQQRFQDAMAVVGKFGNPSLFITVTCNHKWPEITENIPPRDESNNHPMLVSRVFQNRLKVFLDDILKSHAFGVPVAQLHVVEFQKRGLPHAHILTILRREDKLLDTFRIDQLILAEIPDPQQHPRLYQLVSNHMVHGPCGRLNRNSPCMDQGKCTTNFPKPYIQETTVNENGNVIYRRRRDDCRITVTRNGVRIELGNEWIVPYNPYSLMKYGCHINVEACASAHSVKYLYKYFFKGPDQAIVRIRRVQDEVIEYNEVDSFLSGRYLAPSEAAWHINRFPMHANTHTVIRLPVHLPQRQVVRFEEGREREGLDRNRETHLTAWFRLNRDDPDARAYLYPEIPEHYVWKTGPRQWDRRQHGRESIVPRIYSVSVRNQELYCLLLLLLHVRGATSYEDVRSVDGVICDTFAEACRRRNLLADDVEWRRCLAEAVQREMPVQIRQMFAVILVFCEVNDPLALWEEFRAAMIEDFTRQGLTDLQAVQRALHALQHALNVHGKRLSEYHLPEPIGDAFVEPEFDVEQERQEAEHLRLRLNDDQRRALETVLRAVNDDVVQRLFYLNGSGGTGKTYLYNTLIATLHGEDIAVLPVAWTGLAASLLKQGRKVHSRFKLPVPIVDGSVSSMRLNSPDAANIIRAKLIVWDEVSMATRLSFDLVERTLRFLCQNDLPFGGKTVLLGGDFRQCLPIVRNGTRATIVEASVKGSRFWPLFQELRLHANVRADPDQAAFSEWLLHLGNDTLPRLRLGNRHVVEIPADCVVSDKNALIEACFGELAPGHIPNRAILKPLNQSCHEVNGEIIRRMPGEARTYLSADSLVLEHDEEAAAANYTPEFLNTLTPSGMPQHRIVLKVGAVIMLIRNLNLRKNLCNGTRLMVRHLGTNFIDAERIGLNGQLTGDRIFIPRIDLRPTDSTLPFVFKRRQFPIITAYAITINKAQGQTFDAVGIYLSNIVFAHGQLYVAFSRARRLETVFVCVEHTPQQGNLRDEHTTHTVNIVYPEVLG